MRDGVDIRQRVFITRPQNRNTLSGKYRRNHVQLTAVACDHCHTPPRHTISDAGMTKCAGNLSHQSRDARGSQRGYRSCISGGAVISTAT